MSSKDRHDKIKNIIANALRENGIKADVEVRKRNIVDVCCEIDGHYYDIEIDQSQSKPVDVLQDKLAEISKEAKVLNELRKKDWKVTELVDHIAEDLELCSKRTVYRILNRLENANKIDRNMGDIELKEE